MGGAVNDDGLQPRGCPGLRPGHAGPLGGNVQRSLHPSYQKMTYVSLPARRNVEVTGSIRYCSGVTVVPSM
jgi:hypothetical protein